MDLGLSEIEEEILGVCRCGYFAVKNAQVAIYNDDASRIDAY
jgi:hypothetical protein